MPTSAITQHFEALKKAGLDLGAASGSECDAGYGGRCQPYQGGTIYWHPNSGAHALRQRILARYLRTGGPGLNPATGERDLGYPTSDHIRTEDGCFACATFEWGIISEVGGTPVVTINRRLYAAWREMGGPLGQLGHPLSDVYEVEGGRAAWFERGVLWHATGSDDVVVGSLNPPTLGRPMVISVTEPGSLHWITFTGAVAAVDERPKLAAALFSDRLALQQVGGEDLLELVPDSVTREGKTRLLSMRIKGYRRKRFAADFSVVNQSPTLASRTLYSLTFTTSGIGPRVISPHCVYARNDWKTFGVAHITDVHVSRRIEKYRTLLRERGINEERVARLNNWNDNFRAFIKYANHLHREGRLDAVIATGDLVDYVREQNDHPDGPGNFGFFEALVRGEAPGPDKESPGPEPLKVPIFTSLGNHDYRDLPYLLAFEVVPESGDAVGDIPWIGDELKAIADALGDLGIPDLVGVAVDLFSDSIVTQFEGLNLLTSEAAAIMGLKTETGFGIPKVRPDAIAPAVSVNPRMKDGSHYYFRRINPTRSYVIGLGDNRIVMLDTRWDAGMPGTFTELVFATTLEIGSESELNFVGGTPDSLGIAKRELAMLRQAMTAAGNNAVIVGMHAPPLNPTNTDLANFLRETARPSTGREQLLGWLRRNGLPAKSPGWTMKGTPHFHEGPIEDGLDYGIAVGLQEEFAKLLCGGQGQRAVTMLCAGHGHKRIDYRLRWDTAKGKLLTFTDHYLGNPSRYYPCKIVEGSKDKRFLVRIEPGAPAQGRRTRRTDYDGTIWEGTKELVVAPFSRPLDQSTDPAGWWQQYAPIVTQTAALGPCTNTRTDKDVNDQAPGPNFQGLRLLHLDGGCIKKVDYVSIDEVRNVAAAAPAFSPTPSSNPIDGVFDPGAQDTVSHVFSAIPKDSPSRNVLLEKALRLKGANQKPSGLQKIREKLLSKKGGTLKR